MAVHVHFIEHVEMQADGISSITAAARPYVGRAECFSNEEEFRAACAKVQAAMEIAPAELHMVVINTHGVEDTGTWLSMGDNNKPMPLFDKLFSYLPATTLIFVSVCWGGYSANVARLQACGKEARPVVIGALTPLWNTEFDELQDDVLAVLLSHGLDEGRLAEVVRAFNAKLHNEYGQDTARIGMTDGTLIPKQATAGIAWSLLERADESVHDGPFTILSVDGNRVTVSDGAKSWAAAAGRLVRGKGGPIQVGDRFRFKAKEHPELAVLSIVGTPRPA